MTRIITGLTANTAAALAVSCAALTTEYARVGVLVPHPRIMGEVVNGPGGIRSWAEAMSLRPVYEGSGEKIRFSPAGVIRIFCLYELEAMRGMEFAVVWTHGIYPGGPFDLGAEEISHADAVVQSHLRLGTDPMLIRTSL